LCIRVDTKAKLANILLITDGSCCELQLGDVCFIADVCVDENGELLWSSIETGQVDVNVLHPPSQRKYRVWQISVRGLLLGKCINFERLFVERFGLSAKEFRALNFKSVVIHAGADFISSYLFDTTTVEVGEVLPMTVGELLRETERRIKLQCSSLPNKPDLVWLGMGMPSTKFPADGTGFTEGMRLHRLDRANYREHWHEYDRVLTYAHYKLSRERGSRGLLARETSDRLPCFLIGSAASGGKTNGRGYPLAGDLTNAGRLIWGGIGGATRKLGHEMDGLGYFSFMREEDLGDVARWDANLKFEAGTPGHVRAFGEVEDIPSHLFLVRDGHPFIREKVQNN
jgi:hypothetical protein